MRFAFLIWTIILILSVISVNAVTCNDTDVYLRFHFNEGNGTFINDSSGNGRNGTAVNLPTWVTGKLGSALNFNGVNQYINLGQYGNFERTHAFSFETWFKMAGTGSQIFISKLLTAGTYTGWEIYFDGTATNRLYFDEISVATSSMLRTYFTDTTITNNSWHHLIITYNGNSNASDVKFYYDGNLKSNTAEFNSLSASILTNNTLQVSGRGAGTLLLYNGSFDEMVIYDYVLSAQQAQDRYNNGTGIECGIQPYWVCVGYGACQPNNYQSCNNVTDINNANQSYTGNYSEFTPQSCDYCTPSWNCSSFGNCTGNVTACLNVSDNLSCYAQTNLSSDLFYGNLSTYNQACACVPSWNCTGYGVCQPNSTRACNATNDINGCGLNYTGNYSEFTPENCTACVPEWDCTSWDLCNTSDEEGCIGVDDNNTCGQNYTGNYSEFMQVCDYCTPDWHIDSTCLFNNTEFRQYQDTYDCFGVTTLYQDSCYASFADCDSWISCVYLLEEIDCGYDINPLINLVGDKINWQCMINETGNYTCISYVKEQDATIQTNPQPVTFSSGVWSREQENREYFSAQAGLVQPYFLTDGLKSNKTYVFGVLCSSDNGTLTTEHFVTPMYNSLDALASRTIWIKDNIGYIIGGIILLLLIIAVAMLVVKSR